MFYTYVLRSLKDNKLYVGWTINLDERIEKHNKGLVTATKDRTPLVLEYFEGCKNKEKAIAREKYFKTGFGRRFLNQKM